MNTLAFQELYNCLGSRPHLPSDEPDT